jgi:small neutral amino acid transporter SnatA (MarC family)
MILSGQLNSESSQPESRRSIIVSPLAIPMLAGPGSMTFGMISYLKLQGAEKFYLIAAVVTAVVAGALLLSVSTLIDRMLGRSSQRGLRRSWLLLFLSSPLK